MYVGGRMLRPDGTGGSSATSVRAPLAATCSMAILAYSCAGVGALDDACVAPDDASSARLERIDRASPPPGLTCCTTLAHASALMTMPGPAALLNDATDGDPSSSMTAPRASCQGRCLRLRRQTRTRSTASMQASTPAPAARPIVRPLLLLLSSSSSSSAPTPTLDVLAAAGEPAATPFCPAAVAFPEPSPALARV